MMNEISRAPDWFRPFPDIAYFGTYDECSGVNVLPTKKVSMLFSPLERAVMQEPTLLQSIEAGNLVIPSLRKGTNIEVVIDGMRNLSLYLGGNSRVRRSVMDSLKQSASVNFPSCHNDLARLFAAQETVVDLTELRRFAGIEFERADNIKLGIFLTIHGVGNQNDVETAREDLRRKMSEVFVKGQNNVLFMEDPSGRTNNRVKHVNRAIRELSSFKVGYMHIRYKNLVEGKFTTKEILDAALEYDLTMHRLIPRTAEEANSRWTWLVCETVDEFIKQGYEITVDGEKYYLIRPPLTKYLDDEDLTFEEYKAAIAAIPAGFDTRNATMAYQLHLIAQNLKDEGGNILMIGGYLHTGIQHKIPYWLLPSTSFEESVYQSSLKTSQEQDEFTEKVTNGVASEEDWRKAYKSYMSK